MKKYKFTGETMVFEGHLLQQIRYVRNVEYIDKGTVGGWIESEDNLSHEGACCVNGNAKVFGHARVVDDAMITGYAIVKDNALIKGKTLVDNSIIGADTITDGKCHILDSSSIFFYAQGLDGNYSQPNVYGKSAIMNCNIEATGSIINCLVRNKVLFGSLKLEDIEVKNNTH